MGKGAGEGRAAGSPERSGEGVAALAPENGGSRKEPRVHTEVLDRATRRRFSASYKLRIVQEAERCAESGELGSLLRREGLYSSHLTAWRRQYREGALSGLDGKRGRKVKRSSEERRIAELERENARLRRHLKRAETIIEVQKKASEILGIPLEDPDPNERDE